MSDLISRQAAIDDLKGKDPSQIWDTADIEVWINTLPSAQSERKRGKWIGRGEDCYECSECHAVIEGDEVYWRNNYFCYHCGADMRGDQNED